MNALRRFAEQFKHLNEEKTPEVKLARAALFVAILAALATIALVGITAWYAISTSHMVSIMEADFEISNRPYVLVQAVTTRVKDDGVHITCELTNSGRMPGVIYPTYSIIRADTGEVVKPLTTVDRTTIVPGQLFILEVATIPRDLWHLHFDVSLTVDYRSPAQDRSDYRTSRLLKYIGDPEARLQIADLEIR